MSDPSEPSRPDTPTAPRLLPGQEATPVSRAGAAVVGVIVVVVVTLAALLVNPTLADSGDTIGDSSGTSSVPMAEVMPTGHTTEATVTVDGMAFTPSIIDVPVGDTLVVTFTNTGEQRHDLVFANGVATEAIAPGASVTVDVGVIGSDLEGWCSLPGHRQMGMVVHVKAVGAATDDTAVAGHDMTAGTQDAGSSTAAPTMAELMQAAEAAQPHPAALPPLDASTDHHYTFRITQQDDEVAPGLTREVWTYNGTSPGPVLHGRIGDTFHITLVNDGTMGHSIDFHAGDIAPDEPMRTIEPGESLEYVFTAQRSGVWMYHCSTMPMSNHIANGMFGAVIIEPDGLQAVDRSFVVVQSEQYLGADGEPADAAKIADLVPDVVAFNGRAFQYDAHSLVIGTGERVRIWVLDAGPNASLSFHVVGAQFDTVWSEGAYLVRNGQSTDGVTAGATGAQTLALQAAEGGFVEFVPHEAGHYSFVNHQMSLAEKGAHGILVATD